MTLFETLQGVLASTFEVDPSAITPRTTQADLSAWDSVGHINLMLALEEAFGLKLEIDEMLELTSVAAIVRHLEPRQGA